VTYRLDATNYLAGGYTVAANGFRIGGNFADLGTSLPNWTPIDPACAMTQEPGTNIWKITVTYPISFIGAVQQFKFVNGDWGSNEGSTDLLTYGCAIDDGFGNINRTFSIPNFDQTMLYCWDWCFMCQNGSFSNAFQWNRNGSTVTGAQGEAFYASDGGSYTLTVSNNGCTSTSNAVVLTGTAVTPPVIQGTNRFTCAGTPVTLAVSSPAAGTTYRWSTNVNGTSTSVSLAGTYSVRAISNACTSLASTPVNVSVNSLPTPNAGADFSMPQNSGTRTLTASPTGGTWTGTGITSTGIFNSSQNQGLYALQYCFTDANGCRGCDVVNGTIGAPTGNVATPFISPGTGTYLNPVTVSITCATPGATIYYTTNGNTPSVGTSFTKIYTGTFPQNQSGTIRAMAVLAGTPNSSVAVATITITNPVVNLVKITPATGSYFGAQMVSLSTETPGSTIYYTTSGNTPNITTPNGFTKLYTGSFQIFATTTVKAMAIKTGLGNSAVTTSVITVTGIIPTPTISPATGTYLGNQTITITSTTPDAVIYYTTNGNNPLLTSANFFTKLYTGPFQITASANVRAVATKVGMINSSVASVQITVTPSTPTAERPVITPATGTFSGPQMVSMTSATPGAAIYYTTSGNNPAVGTGFTKLYSLPFAMNATVTVRAMSVATGFFNSGVTSSFITIGPAARQSFDDSDETTVSDPENDLSVFPNPVSREFTLVSKSGFEDAHFEVFNPLGQKVLSKEIQNGNEEMVSMEGLSTGLYTIRVVSKAGVREIRFVKR
jgi:hypothetical protein